MSSSIESLVTRDYQYGFVTDIEADTFPPGLNEDVGDALARSELRLPVDRVFTLDEAPAALDHMRANRHFGKIVMTVRS